MTGFCKKCGALRSLTIRFHDVNVRTGRLRGACGVCDTWVRWVSATAAHQKMAESALAQDAVGPPRKEEMSPKSKVAVLRRPAASAQTKSLPVVPSPKDLRKNTEAVLESLVRDLQCAIEAMNKASDSGEFHTTIECAGYRQRALCMHLTDLGFTVMPSAGCVKIEW